MCAISTCRSSHFLSGPIGVEGAQPGDLIVVDFLDIGAFPHNSWGFNGFFSKKNGGGFLTDHFPLAQKSIWDFSGMFTHSRHVPGVEFAGLIHPGLIGCLPSKSLLETWNAREIGLIKSNPTRVPPLANPPFEATAHMGRLTGEAKAAAAAEGARTVPPREHGGNCDIKDLSRGARVFFPVYVPGGGLSVGDLHFSQGDGEITFCGAIEMPGWIHMRVASVIKDGMAKYGIKNPIFKPSPITPKYQDYLIFEGISVDEAGAQHYLDVHIAYRQACLNAIEYLKKFGYSGGAGLRDFGDGAGAGAYQRRRRYPERLRHAMAADRDLQLRHPTRRRWPHGHGGRRHGRVAGAGQGVGHMPVYTYDCTACGPFDGMRPLAEYDQPACCPGCGRAAPRALTLPAFAAMDGARRVAMATNEHSAHAPQSSRTHPAGCGCCRPAGTRRADGLKSFAGGRLG